MAAAVDVTVIFGRFVEGVDIALVRAPPVDFGEQPLRITFEDLPIFVDRGRSRDLSPCRYGHLDISWRSTRSKGERSRSCKLRPEKCRKPMPVKAGGGFPSIVPGVRDRCDRLLRLIPGRLRSILRTSAAMRPGRLRHITRTFSCGRRAIFGWKNRLLRLSVRSSWETDQLRWIRIPWISLSKATAFNRTAFFVSSAFRVLMAASIFSRRRTFAAANAAFLSRSSRTSL
ncbi:hypothetical protein SKP52_14245 [Sphingopyxis fribergensis]|uniref:Uncharacterized protein n=1 Tax=Sphingopyxis fribergensis TaxID=1515612 RepID=A0A0A7PIE8_9SPHN|nr:hypothetical protein SKP52_14245 [Sphingopyxis fribergensis]